VSTRVWDGAYERACGRVRRYFACLDILSTQFMHIRRLVSLAHTYLQMRQSCAEHHYCIIVDLVVRQVELFHQQHALQCVQTKNQI
jgi:hypothetical protein